jgi:hypothetical protein
MQLKQEEDDAEDQPHEDQRASPPGVSLSLAGTCYADTRSALRITLRRARAADPAPREGPGFT